jgi:hypothetical protein
MGLQTMQIDKALNIPPTDEIWGDIESDPEILSIKDMYFGKTNEELATLLEKNYIVRCLDLGAMPDEVFMYYSIGFYKFILDHVSDDDRFGVFLGSFLDAVSRKRDDSPSVWQKFWMESDSLLMQFSDRLYSSQMDEMTKIELMDEISEIRSEILR